jgi:hypothetical protein
VQELTGEGTAVMIDGDPVASTVELGEAEIPISGDASSLDLPGGEMRVASAPLGGADPGARLAILGPIDTESFFTTRPAVFAALALFFGVALLSSCCWFAGFRDGSPRCSAPRSGSAPAISAVSSPSRGETRWRACLGSSTR